MAGNTQQPGGTPAIEDYEEDMTTHLNEFQTTQTQSRNLTPKQQDIRGWSRIQSREPKLQASLKQLSKKIGEKAKEVNDLKNDAGTLASLAKNLKVDHTSTSGLGNAERISRKIKVDLLNHLELPQELLSLQTRRDVTAFVRNPQHRPSNNDHFSTNDDECTTVIVQNNLSTHDSGNGWNVSDIAILIVKLNNKCEGLNSELASLQQAKAEVSEQLDEERDAWNTAEAHFLDQVDEANRISEEWKSRGEELTAVREQLDDANNQLDNVWEDVKRTGELITACETADEGKAQAESRCQELQKEIDQLKKQLGDHGDRETQIEELRKDLESLETIRSNQQNTIHDLEQTRESQSKAIKDRDEQVKEFAVLTKHLVQMNIKPTMPVEVALLRPIFIYEKVKQEFIGAASGAEIAEMNVATAALNQRIVANRYLDECGNEVPGMTVMQLVAIVLNLEEQTDVSELQSAIQLETGIIADLKENPAPPNAALVYQYACDLTLKCSGLAFAVVCTALVTLHERHPHSNWVKLVESVLHRRFGSIEDVQPGLAIEQMACSQLCKSLPKTLAGLQVYFPDIAATQASNKDHIMDIALRCGRAEVVSVRGTEGVLTAMVDWCDDAKTRAMYFLWKSDNGISALSTADLKLSFDNDLFLWTCKSEALNDDRSRPYFELQVADDSDFSNWLKRYKSEQLDTAWKSLAEDFCSNLLAPEDMDWV